MPERSAARRRAILATGFAAVTITSGCGTSWTRLDGSSTDSAKLAQALEACHVEHRLEGLARAADERNRQLGQAKSNPQKMIAKEDYTTIERRVYREIDSCMRQQGYRRRGP